MRWKSLILGCALAFTPALPVPAKAPAAPAGNIVHAHPALWVVKDADTTIYLFGTIHLLKPDLRWFEGSVRKAFDQSQQVVVEVADKDQAAAQGSIMQRALLLDGPTITSRLPEASREKFVAALQSHNLPPAVFDKVKPWFASITLAVLPLHNLGYDPKSGADHLLQKAALESGKTLTGLETAEEQIGFFDSLPEPVQMTMLSQTLDELPKLGDTIARMIDVWSRGQPDRLADLMNESVNANPELEKLLLTDRNDRWADWIKARLDKPGTVFIAVGAGHLAGKLSVQAMLKQRGIASRLIKRTD